MTKSTHRAPVDGRSLLRGRASHETHEKNLSIGVFLASEPGARCRLERQDALIGLVINYIFLEMDLSVCAELAERIRKSETPTIFKITEYAKLEFRVGSAFPDQLDDSLSSLAAGIQKMRDH